MLLTMTRFPSVEAFTSVPRDEAIARVLEVLGTEGGFVTGTNELGGLALTLSFELPSAAVTTLAARAREVGIRIDEAHAASLVAAAESDAHVTGALLLRFHAREPDRRVEIPKVPG